MSSLHATVMATLKHCKYHEQTHTRTAFALLCVVLTQVVTIPGAGFGPGGEGFLRLSAFAPRESCVEAVERLRAVLA